MKDLKAQIGAYEGVPVSGESGETEVWDRVVFPEAIRSRELDLILKVADRVKATRVLDFGCGAGWLSRALSGRGYRSVGIDVSQWLAANAARLSSGGTPPSFLVGDCMNLPLKGMAFDLIVGIGVLHHLEPEKGLRECQRVLKPGGCLLVIEPNSLSPIAALGRRIAPLKTRTEEEKPFHPRELKGLFLKTGWHIEEMRYLFPYSFAISRLLGLLHLGGNWIKILCPAIRGSERLLEKVVLVQQLSWCMAVVVTRR